MRKDILNKRFIATLNSQPEEVISLFNLIYTTPELLNISRQVKGKSFIYLKHGKKTVISSKDLKFYNSLTIPPAWQNVKIADVENAHILAIGRDSKNRKQYRYHPKWQKIRNQTKFYKMVAFAEALPLLRRRVNIDIEQTHWTKTKVLAIVIKLLEESHIRIGNTYYTKRNKTYGLSTLRSKHLSLYKDKFTLEYIGKKGKQNKVTIRNKKLTRLINKCEEIPGWELFKYYDDKGQKQVIDSTMVNEYIHEACGAIFSAKDFRTWAATLIVFDTLKKARKSKTIKHKEKQILSAIDIAADALNNTRNVCRKYYVHPHITQTFLNGVIKPYFDMVNQLPESADSELQPNEQALKALLKTFKPNFKTES